MTLPPSTDDDRAWVHVTPRFEDASLPDDDPAHPDPDEEPPPVTLADMLATGATYRRLDYWVRKGWLNPEPGDPKGKGGSGYGRKWSRDDLTTADLLVRLTASGINADTAARIAADFVKYRVTSYSTEYGIRISWTTRPPGRIPVA